MRGVAIITGAGQGIGRALACGFRAEDYAVLTVVLNADKAEDVATEIRLAGYIASAVATDVSNRAACEDMAAHALTEFGAIEVLVNCAVVKASARRRFWDIEDSEWDHLMAVNVRETWLAMRSVVPALRERGGSIVNLSSATVNAGGTDFLHYVTSKAAVSE